MKSYNTYFIQAQGDNYLIKIGKTAGPIAERQKVLNTGSPLELSAVAVCAGNQEDEIETDFGELRVKGEWYEPDPILLNWILRRTIPLNKLKTNKGNIYNGTNS